MKAIQLQSVHVNQLKEVVNYLFPEYPYVTIVDGYVNLSETPIREGIIFNLYRVHWLELLMREGLRRMYSPGIHEETWIHSMSKLIIRALIIPEVKHPITVFYEEYLIKVRTP